MLSQRDLDKLLRFLHCSDFLTSDANAPVSGRQCQKGISKECDRNVSDGQFCPPFPPKPHHIPSNFSITASPLTWQQHHNPRFGSWSGQLGDGRAMSLGNVLGFAPDLTDQVDDTHHNMR